MPVCDDTNVASFRDRREDGLLSVYMLALFGFF